MGGSFEANGTHRATAHQLAARHALHRGAGQLPAPLLVGLRTRRSTGVACIARDAKQASLSTRGPPDRQLHPGPTAGRVVLARHAPLLEWPRDQVGACQVVAARRGTVQSHADAPHVWRLTALALRHRPLNNRISRDARLAAPVAPTAAHTPRCTVTPRCPLPRFRQTATSATPRARGCGVGTRVWHAATAVVPGGQGMPMPVGRL